MNSVDHWFLSLSITDATLLFWGPGMVIIAVACWYFGSPQDNRAEREKARETRAIAKRKKREAKLLRQLRVTAKELATRSEPWSPKATRGFMRAYQVGNDAKGLGR